MFDQKDYYMHVSSLSHNTQNKLQKKDFYFGNCIFTRINIAAVDMVLWDDNYNCSWLLQTAMGNTVHMQ